MQGSGALVFMLVCLFLAYFPAKKLDELNKK